MEFELGSNPKDYNVTYTFRVGQVWLLKVFASRVVTMDEEAEVLVRTRQPEVHQLIGAHRDPGGIADNIHRSVGNLRNEFKWDEAILVAKQSDAQLTYLLGTKQSSFVVRLSMAELTRYGSSFPFTLRSIR